MIEISLFTEDYGHEKVLRTLVQRLADQYDLFIELKNRSVRGGHPKVINELTDYVRDIKNYHEKLPDLIIVATDSNCKGFLERRKQFQQVISTIQDRVIFAIPDPYVEKWLLLDSAAFKNVLGVACETPDQKCEKDRYKNLLSQAVIKCGLTPLLGGLEHAEDIVNAMDLKQMQKRDESLGSLLEELHARFRVWKASA